LTIIGNIGIIVDMNPKKPKTRKSTSAGISLEPDLTRQCRLLAEANGFQNLSNLVRFLLTQELKKAGGQSSLSLLEQPGKPMPQPHSGDAATEPLDPSAGGCKPPTRYMTAAEAKRQARSSN
jgi:hypothetical protein